MNIDLIKDALYNPSNTKKLLLAKEFSIRLQDVNFTERLNSALNFANTYKIHENKVELMFMRK